eukprot:scaffold1901_cov236-Pinguiococcus_pyrenoidosus.AAC.9
MLQQLRGFLGEKRHRREQRNARGASQLKNGAVESQGLVTSGGAAVIPVSLTMKGLGVAADVLSCSEGSQKKQACDEDGGRRDLKERSGGFQAQVVTDRASPELRSRQRRLAEEREENELALRDAQPAVADVENLAMLLSEASTASKAYASSPAGATKPHRNIRTSARKHAPTQACRCRKNKLLSIADSHRYLAASYREDDDATRADGITSMVKELPQWRAGPRPPRLLAVNGVKSLIREEAACAEGSRAQISKEAKVSSTPPSTPHQHFVALHLQPSSSTTKAPALSNSECEGRDSPWKPAPARVR